MYLRSVKLEKKLSIKQWAEEDRPREKMLQKGIQSLSDAELLAILIGSGNSDETAVELSRRILSASHNNLNELGKVSVADLKKSFKGIGEAKAITIAAALELGRRRNTADAIERKKVVCSRHIFEIFHPILSDLAHEEFWLLLLNKANRVIDTVKINQGGIGETIADIRLILKSAIDKRATSIAVCHNHPSGSATPSKNDIDFTEKIKIACRTVDILFHDHIIIAANNFYSFADEEII